MDQIVLDCGDDPVAAGDVAMLFGPGDDGEPTADDWAEAVGTINYEIVTRFGSTRVPRVYDGGGRGVMQPGSDGAQPRREQVGIVGARRSVVGRGRAGRRRRGRAGAGPPVASAAPATRTRTSRSATCRTTRR